MKKFPTWLRVTGFFGGLLLIFLMAGVYFYWPLSVRILVSIVIAFAAGLVSYGVIPTKANMNAIRNYLRAQGKVSEAEDVGAKDWLSWVLFFVIVGVLVQVFAKALE